MRKNLILNLLDSLGSIIGIQVTDSVGSWERSLCRVVNGSV